MRLLGANRVLLTLDLDFANPMRFPPANTSGIAVLRVRERPGRNDVDLVTRRLIFGLAAHNLKARLWVVEPAHIREYRPPSEEE